MRNNSERGQMLIALIVVLLLIASFLFVGGFSKIKTHIAKGDPIGDLTSDQNSSQSALQLQTLKPHPMPPSQCVVQEHEFDSEWKNICHPAGPSCKCNGQIEVHCSFQKCVSAKDISGVNGAVSCEQLQAQTDVITHKPVTFTSVNGETVGWVCASVSCNIPDGITCLAKPVIYLYPMRDTLVDVEVKTPGKIVVSDPHYPREGWKNVLAKPNGTLIYNDKTYNELFYESEVNSVDSPKNGIIIRTSILDEKLKNLIYQLGLNESESQEFLDFWLPRLKSLNKPYILFSIIDKNAKEKNDKVIINPTPDTRIEFIAYFKPLDFPIAIEPLKLPNRPQRIGFTEVEWGGTIDY